MFAGRWFQSIFGRRRWCHVGKQLRRGYRPVLEILESRWAPAITFVVDTTADTHQAVAGTDPHDATGNISLRSAIEAANEGAGGGGAVVIQFSSALPQPATINLSLTNDSTAATTSNDLVIGSPTNLNVTIMGPGDPALVVIDQTVPGNAVLEAVHDAATGLADLPLNLTLENLTITGGTAGGVLCGAGNGQARSSTGIINCDISGNSNKQSGGGIADVGGNLTVTDSVISGNSTSGQGGGISYELTGGGPLSQGNLSASGTAFTNNVADGLGLALAGGGLFTQVSDIPGNSLTVTGATFVGNQAPIAGEGGAVAAAGGALSVTDSRFVGNTATAGGDALAQSGAGSISATDDWFGTNSNPAGVANLLAGKVSASPWLMLSLTPGTATVISNQMQTFTAGFTTDSAGNTIAPASLTAFGGLPVAFAALRGSVTPGNSTTAAAAPATGTATTTYTAPTTGGTDVVQATIDGVQVTASVMVNVLTLTPATLPNWTQGVAYKQGVVAINALGAVKYSLVAGVLPPGLKLNPATGAITGIPNRKGTYKFTIQATSSNGTAGQTYTVVINPHLVVTPFWLPPFTVGVPYKQTLTATGGTGPISMVYTIQRLPAGITITPPSPATKVITISGTPTTSSIASLMVTATDSVGAKYEICGNVFCLPNPARPLWDRQIQHNRKPPP